MDPDRGRASRPCASCRKQKARCYESGVPGRCSFAHDALVEEPTLPDSSTGARLERLERAVTQILDHLGENPCQLSDGVPQTSAPTNRPTAADPEDSIQKGDCSAAPVMVIRDLAADTGIESISAPQTVSIDSLVQPDLALNLLSIFTGHYANSLLLRVRKSALLFCACCLIAGRHTPQEVAATLAPKLYENARSFAVLVLCMWSTTVGQVPLSIDSWLLNGFALQHCQSSSLFTAVINQSPTTSAHDKQTLDRLFLWNHICLVHPHYCVGTSRRSMLQDWHIARCRAIIDSDRVTNYELRMVAEIHLYRTTYGLLTGPVAIPQSQPRTQFLMMGFHFSHLLLYDRSLKAKSARAQQSIVSEMISHSTTIIRLAMDTVDERTRHLSDHIYHMITFAAIIVCRLIGGRLDELISSLVLWLHSIGLPCHSAHTFGTIISQVQQKSRPPLTSTASNVAPSDNMSNEDFRYYFPEFLGVGATPNGSWVPAPNFAFFPQDYTLPDEMS
ncbi:uncharacterized protein BDV17DRAFT_281100 [Aspergillus undulatus]|uniref:uncharacterized protein n=1 Tax=Aspergillus undulatus TaxID=1810928 RepID=UPI003CCCC7E9